ncbi:lipoprotein [Dissulfurispira thermophila]|uniref:Lipoprotein n=1 Tax=Dissulfurispira thermophila TaxID=2715679 RepID=A0A7G1H033_9BACT|nr:lipoprotein [Dissulfurispira thermophila]
MLNSSKDQIVVTFKYPVEIERTTPYLERLKIENPKLYEATKPTPCKFEKEIKNRWFPKICDENLENCRLLQSNEFIYNQDECFVEIHLKPSQSIKLFEICCNYTGTPEEKDNGRSIADVINVMSLTIKSPDETKVYKGIKLMRAFKKIDKTKYVIEYKGDKK